MNEQRPLPYRVAARGLIECVASTVRLLARHCIHLPRQHVGLRLRFADGTSARVFRETVVDAVPQDPCVLVVEFRLWTWAVRGRRTHALFRWESLLNTPLFVGFPGFVSKLWLANDEHGIYRGVYEWDSPERAERYARSLWRVLAMGASRTPSITGCCLTCGGMHCLPTRTCSIGEPTPAASSFTRGDHAFPI